jgi:hypothetical protein
MLNDSYFNFVGKIKSLIHFRLLFVINKRSLKVAQVAAAVAHHGVISKIRYMKKPYFSY